MFAFSSLPWVMHACFLLHGPSISLVDVFEIVKENLIEGMFLNFFYRLLRIQLQHCAPIVWFFCQKSGMVKLGL